VARAAATGAVGSTSGVIALARRHALAARTARRCTPLPTLERFLARGGGGWARDGAAQSSVMGTTDVTTDPARPFLLSGARACWLPWRRQWKRRRSSAPSACRTPRLRASSVF
jgi:hypothetical protein